MSVYAMTNTSLPWGINRLKDMVGGQGVGAAMPDGRYVMAVPEPYYTSGWSRVGAAWWVLTGRAQAVIWPKDGELEDAVNTQR